MASTSGGPKTTLPVGEAASNFYLYPAPLAKYDDVVADSKLFLQTLGNLHQSMGTKFMYASSLHIIALFYKISICHHSASFLF